MTTMRCKATGSSRAEHAVRCAGVLAALVFATTPAWAQGPKVTELPGTYETTTVDNVGEWTEYDFTLATDGQTHPYRVKYQISSVTGRSATIDTTRTLLVNGEPQKRGHVVSTNYKRDKSEIKHLQDQLLKNKELETWKNVVVKKLEVTGTEAITVGGTKLDCLKIEFEYSGTVGEGLVPVEAKEVIYYCDKVAVTKMAKFVGSYELSTINGVKKQKVELTMLKSGKTEE